MHRTSIYTGLLLGTLAACNGAVDSAEVTIDAHPLSPAEAREESAAALESGYHRITVRRLIPVPDRCRTLAGDLVQAAGTLTLRVMAHPTTPTCARDETYLAYTALIDGLRPGRYNLRVIHGYSEERIPARMVLEHPILVLERSIEVE
jgi:hypothetical protein